MPREVCMVDRTFNDVVIVRKRNRIWRMMVVGLVTIVALMNVFVWQYVIQGIGASVLVVVGFLYFVSYLESFNYYHFNCPVCGNEFKTSDFEMIFTRHCVNCNNTFTINLIDNY